MNSKFIASTVVAIAALTGANAFAQGNMTGEAYYEVPTSTSISNTTRAQVQAEYLQARQAGDVPANNEATFVAVKPATSVTSRADVRDEAVAWLKTHVISNDN